MTSTCKNLIWTKLVTPIIFFKPLRLIGLGQQVGHGDFFWSNGVTWRESTVAVGMPTGQETAARRRTGGMRGIKMIQPQARFSHLVQDRCLEMRVLIVACLRPPMVIAHQQDEVWSFLCFREKRAQENPSAAKQDQIVHWYPFL